MSRINNQQNIFQVSQPAPFSTIGLFTYLRTYARRHDEMDPKSTVESWKECVERIVTSCNNQLHVNFTGEEMKEVFSLLYNLKCSVAGRFLWQLGTRTVDNLGLPSLQNCSFVTVNEPVRPFTWAMNFLMLGSGVGYRVLPEDLVNFPDVKYALATRKDTKDADFIVPDSREGWVKLLGKVLKAHFYSGKSFTYSCTLLRSKGAPIKSFGGLASGPEVLCDGIDKINNVLNKRAGQRLRPIDALDVMNIIGMIVVSGNVRRSAQICLGYSKDTEYLNAKNWASGSIPNWRAFSNNSVICNDINEILENKQFWEGYNGTGEPYGLINLKLSKSCGRLGETQYNDPDVEGYNPCAEQSLSNYETCCLGELYLPNITSKEELYKCATYIYRICKHSLTLPCKESEETERIVHKNMRMGIGVTGYLQATDEQRSWLSDCYKYLREFDKKYSIERGFPASIKLTTCKPSGCSRGDMLVQTDKGLLRLNEIGDVSGDEWQKVENLQVQTDSERCELVSKFYINGNVQTRKIFTEDGNELESSLNHRYRVVEDGKYIWKTVEELKVGDKLVVCLGGHPENCTNLLPKMENIHMKQPERMSDELARFIGLFQLYGYEKEGNVVFNTNNQKNIEWYITSAYFNIFGIVVDEITQQFVIIKNQNIISWLRFQDILDKDHIPKIIRTSSKDFVSLFIHNCLLSINNTSICITTSGTFAKEYLVLCRSIGYNSKIYHSGHNSIIQFDYYNDDKERKYKNYWLDPIVSLEDSECDTYDIEVENVHHYRLGGTVSHNTLSLLGGCTSGVHPGFARYYKRRIRIASESALIKVAKEHGYPVEFVKNFDGSLDHSTQIITFPCSLPENTVLAENCTAIEQLEWVKKLQSEWSDNSVSVTVYYRKNELADIKEWLRNNYNNSVKSVSFLLHSDHGFQQAPLEQISKEEYEELYSKCRAITDLSGICFTEENEELINQGECVGGVCPMR